MPYPLWPPNGRMAPFEPAVSQEGDIMWIRSMYAGTMAFAALILLMSGTAEAQKDGKEKEWTVKEIMAKSHGGKDALRTKVMKGNASNDEKKQLIDLYTALVALKAPKGDENDWKERTKKVVELVKTGDPADLKAIDCKGCHGAFKK